MNQNRLPIAMVEDFWRNSPLSFAAHTGRIKIDGVEYIIVDKRGHDIFECSMEAEKAGREKAIEPGEPADLCRVDFVPIYRKLGRRRFIAFCKDNPDMWDIKTAKQRLKEWQQNNPA